MTAHKTKQIHISAVRSRISSKGTIFKLCVTFPSYVLQSGVTKTVDIFFLADAARNTYLEGWYLASCWSQWQAKEGDIQYIFNYGPGLSLGAKRVSTNDGCCVIGLGAKQGERYGIRLDIKGLWRHARKGKREWCISSAGLHAFQFVRGVRATGTRNYLVQMSDER